MRYTDNLRPLSPWINNLAKANAHVIQNILKITVTKPGLIILLMTVVGFTCG